jgi:hypothetical protein
MARAIFDCEDVERFLRLMSESVLIDLSERSLAVFDDAQRVAPVSNLMTVLAREEGALPASPLARVDG